MRIPKLHKFMGNKKLLKIAGIIVGVLLILGGAGWVYATNTSTQNFRQALDDKVKVVKEKVNSVADTFKGFTSIDETEKRLTVIDSFSDELKKMGNELPVVPRFLGVSLVPKEDEDKRAKLTDHLKKLAEDFRKSHDLLVYQHGTAALIKETADLSGKNADEQAALAAGWQQLVTNLSNQSNVPEAVKAVNQQLIAAATAVQASMATLPDLYKAKNYDGFDAKKKEVEARLGDFRKLADTFQAVNVTYDQQIASDYAKLTELLK